MKTISIEDIRKWSPCYDPSKHLPEGWTGTALDILRRDDVPAEDRFWVVLREELLDANTLRLFAVLCVRQVEHLLTDERSKVALDTAEKFVFGFATKEELRAAAIAAWAAAMAGAGDAVRAAALVAAGAMAAANDAARYAAMAAANDAAKAAAGDAAMVADAAWDAARESQIRQLIKMIDEGIDENFRATTPRQQRLFQMPKMWMRAKGAIEYTRRCYRRLLSLLRAIRHGG